MGEQIRQLSAGTITSLSNLRDYQDIDRLREAVAKLADKWVRMGLLDDDDPWQLAWNIAKSCQEITAITGESGSQGKLT